MRFTCAEWRERPKTTSKLQPFLTLRQWHPKVFSKEFGQCFGWLEFISLDAPDGDARTAGALSQLCLGQVQGASPLPKPGAKGRCFFRWNGMLWLTALPMSRRSHSCITFRIQKGITRADQK